MPNQTKFIAVGRGAATVLSHLPEIGISKDRCLAAVPVIKEEKPFLNSVWVDLNFEIDEKKQKIGEELYKVALSCEKEIDEFLTDAQKLIIVCCLGTLSGLMTTPRIIRLAERKGIPVSLIVAKPFTWEGKTWGLRAERSLSNLKDKVNDLIVYNMDEAFNGIDPNTPTRELFKIVDKEMLNLIKEKVCYIKRN